MQSATHSLFRRPVPVDPVRHGGAGIIPMAGFEFAAGLTAIPLGFEELAPASAHVPIVFLGDAPSPHGIYGVRAGHNLFVGSDGRWRPQTYVPLLVRHYPFQVLLGPGGPVLAVDEESECFRAEGGEPLFRDGQTSALSHAAFDACLTLAGDFARAEGFGAALADRALLRACDLHVTLSDGEQVHVIGAAQLDLAAVESLTDTSFIGLRRGGFLQAIYTVLLSTGRWESLMAMAGVAERLESH